LENAAAGFYRLDALCVVQPAASMHWRVKYEIKKNKKLTVLAKFKSVVA